MVRRGRVKKIDEYSRHIIFTDGKALPIDMFFQSRESWLEI